MIIVDKHINSLCYGFIPKVIRDYYGQWGITLEHDLDPLVSPYDPALVNPASLDIRIGETAKLRVKDGYHDIDLIEFSPDNPYMMCPGDRILVGSLETINLPNFLTAQFKLKSSRAREWYGHQLAGFADPGWNGSKLTMEIVNNDIAPLPLYCGLKIGQLIFSLTFGLPDKDYSITGRYNNDKGAAASKG
jgi:dCTP deaminase